MYQNLNRQQHSSTSILKEIILQYCIIHKIRQNTNTTVESIKNDLLNSYNGPSQCHVVGTALASHVIFP